MCGWGGCQDSQSSRDTRSDVGAHSNHTSRSVHKLSSSNTPVNHAHTLQYPWSAPQLRKLETPLDAQLQVRP
jgi:hypothetical protein